MYNITEFRANQKQAFARANITPIKILKGKQIYYLLSEEQFKAMQTKAIIQAMDETVPDEPTTTFVSRVMPQIPAPELQNLNGPFQSSAPNPVTGYPCCQQAKPCKHWTWDGNISSYVNTLTGARKEAAI
jgi:hypothetical protein